MNNDNLKLSDVFEDSEDGICISVFCHCEVDHECKVVNVKYEVICEDIDALVPGKPYNARMVCWFDKNMRPLPSEGDSCELDASDRKGDIQEIMRQFNAIMERKAYNHGDFKVSDYDTLAGRAASAINEYMNLLGDNLNNVLVIMKSQCCTIPGVWAMKACDYSPVDDYDSDCDIIPYESLDDALKSEREIVERPTNDSNELWRYRMAKLAIHELERLQ